jgi:Skp family chaperone for outer membrane proteins
MKNNNVGLFIAAALSLPPLGCGGLATSATNQPSNVAILDLERLASETGYLRQINARLQDVSAGLQAELGKVQNTLNAQLGAKQEKFGDKPSKEQKEELNKLYGAAQLQLQQAQQNAVARINKERSQSVAQLHDTLRPYAKQIAADHGMKVVLLKSDTWLFDSDPSADITDEVIAAVLRAKGQGHLTERGAATPATAAPATLGNPTASIPP